MGDNLEAPVAASGGAVAGSRGAVVGFAGSGGGRCRWRDQDRGGMCRWEPVGKLRDHPLSGVAFFVVVGGREDRAKATALPGLRRWQATLSVAVAVVVGVFSVGWVRVYEVALLARATCCGVVSFREGICAPIPQDVTRFECV